MWQPDPAWTALPAGAGTATVGVWRAVHEGVPAIVKRLARPVAEDPALLSDSSHAGYWRRELEVALAPERVAGPGLVPPRYLRCDEDEDGATLWAEEVVAEPPTSLLVARCLGRFAGSPYDVPSWASRRTLSDRLVIAESRGGWPTLGRTTLADAAEHLWEQRGSWLARRDAGPHGRLHGDAVPANFVATRSGDVVAVDWQGFGAGPIGTDLGYYALSAREDFEVLLATYVDGVRETSPVGDPDADAIRTSAAVMCVYTALSRAEWALSRVAPGEGALAGKFTHPAVAPHLRALQRQAPQIESLLG
ncbi:MAG: aminoglycoside phosphotransferase family protein [Marmoricola sp.]|nr:aminoglycoside phosphotransferase family protein [Marmoricola sp.]